MCMLEHLFSRGRHDAAHAHPRRPSPELRELLVAEPRVAETLLEELLLDAVLLLRAADLADA